MPLCRSWLEGGRRQLGQVTRRRDDLMRMSQARLSQLDDLLTLRQLETDIVIVSDSSSHIITPPPHTAAVLAQHVASSSFLTASLTVPVLTAYLSCYSNKRQKKIISLQRRLRTTIHINITELWNSLPINLRQCCSLQQFKRLIKTFLFSAWGHDALWHST